MYISNITSCEELTHQKRLWCWEGSGAGEKGTTEDEMAGWHHWLDGSESEWTPGVGDGQGGLACCDSWGHKESDTTEWLIWSDLTVYCAVLSHSVMSDSLWPPWTVTHSRLLCPWGFSRQKYWSGLHALLQGSSQPMDRTQVTHIAGIFFTVWATREAQIYCNNIDYFYSCIFNPDFLFQVPVVTMYNSLISFQYEILYM